MFGKVFVVFQELLVVFADMGHRKIPSKKPFRPESSDCAECVTFSLPRIKFKFSSGVFE